MKLFNITKFLFFIFQFMIQSLQVSSKSGFITYYNNHNKTACGFDSDLYSDFAQVSISSLHWDDSQSCGSCLEINGTGVGEGDTPFAGTYQAIVTNVCDVCEENTFSLLADGDGKWEIEYEFVSCNFDSNVNPIEYKLVNSNEYYIRLQIINTPYPISELSINNKPCTRTPDNFWTHVKPSLLGIKKYIFPLHIKFKTTDDTEYHGLIYNKNTFTKFKLVNLRH